MTQPNSFERYQNFHLQKAAAADTSNLSSEHASTGGNATQIVMIILSIGVGAVVLYVGYKQLEQAYRLKAKAED